MKSEDGQENSVQYKGIKDCFKKIYETEGLKGFWKGNLCLRMLYFPRFFMDIAINDYLIGIANQQAERHPLQALTLQVASNWIAAGVSLLCVQPLDLARTKIATDGGSEKKYGGIIDCLTKISYHEGFSGLYRGFYMSMTMLAAYKFNSTILGMLSDKLVSSFIKNPSQATENLLIITSTVAAGLAGYPFDTLNRRFHHQVIGNKKYKNQNEIDFLMQILDTEGLSSLYKGITVGLFYVPISAIPILLPFFLEDEGQPP